MALWSTAKALNLTCRLVPILSRPQNQWDVTQKYDLYEPEFGSLFDAASGNFKIDKWDQWEVWVYKIPENAEITWLNYRQQTLQELQFAYATVSPQKSASRGTVEARLM